MHTINLINMICPIIILFFTKKHFTLVGETFIL